MERFSPEIEARLEAAARACAAQGATLTPLRRVVLGLVLEAQQPIGAYALLDLLKRSRAGAAPPTVYRALDFLMERGLVHKVERLNAFVGCPIAAEHAGHGHAHAVQFLICSRCGRVEETEDQGIAAAIARAAERAGFRPARATVEIEGTCRACTG
ncbi:MAG: transcriptional repressor [Elioraea sp.]|nr:transcriptional repressor [Elioraea sp.]